MPWIRGVDLWADPSKQYETRRDMIARRRLMFEQGEGEKENKNKRSESWAAMWEAADRGSGEGCRLELGPGG